MMVAPKSAGWTVPPSVSTSSTTSGPDGACCRVNRRASPVRSGTETQIDQKYG